MAGDAAHDRYVNALGSDPAIAPENDGPGNAAYQDMMAALAAETARAKAGR